MTHGLVINNCYCWWWRSRQCSHSISQGFHDTTLSSRWYIAAPHIRLWTIHMFNEFCDTTALIQCLDQGCLTGCCLAARTTLDIDCDCTVCYLHSAVWQLALTSPIMMIRNTDCWNFLANAHNAKGRYRCCLSGVCIFSLGCGACFYWLYLKQSIRGVAAMSFFSFFF